MSWGLGSWKRQSDLFHILLGYGEREEDSLSREPVTETALPILLKNGQPINPGDPSFPLLPSSSSTSSSLASLALAATAAGGLADPTALCKYRIQLDWSSTDDEEQIALKLQSQLMVTLPAPHDKVDVLLSVDEVPLSSPFIRVQFSVSKKREALRAISVSRTLGGSNPQGDGWGVLTRLMALPPASSLTPSISYAEELLGFAQHWRSLVVLNLSGCSLTVLPIDVSRVPMLEKIFLDNNKLSILPPEFGQLEHLQVLRLDHNMLVSLPGMLYCIKL